MAEFFGSLERLAADLYPWRYLIGAALLLAIAAVCGVAYLKRWYLWVWQRRIPVAIVGTPLLALVGFLAYDLGSPLFTNVTVEEEFPFAFSAVVEGLDLGDMDIEDVDNAMKLIAMVDQEVVEEAMPDMAPKTKAQAAAQPTAPSSTPPTPSPAVAAPQVPATAAPAEPVKLKSGEFRDQDSFHKGSGQAAVYRGPDGAHLLRLENFDVTNGPDLHVILSPHPDPMNRDQLKTEGYVDIGKLKGNLGNQNYEIPDGVDVTRQQSVVIYCAPFHVIFSVAPLREES